jgi:nitroreductase
VELQEAMRTNGTCRRFKPEPVPDEVLMKAFEVARFAPQGGNRQPVRWIVVRDAETKRQLKEWYLVPWREYLAQALGGGVRVNAAPLAVQKADAFAEHLDDIPLLVIALARLEDLHVTDLELGRVSIVGGASVYPTVQNFLLACREAGLGTALTTLLCHYEPQVKELLGIPEGYATACHIGVGYPYRPFPRKLTRMPVEEIVFKERFGQRLVSG